MTVRDAATLKGYFNTGDVPSETNFADFIESMANIGGANNFLGTQYLYEDLGFVPVAPPTAPTIASVSAGGSVNDGAHYYALTYVTAYGETQMGTLSSVATAGGGSNTVNLSSIPVSADTRVLSKNIYRTKAGGAVTTAFLVANIAAATTTYADTKADAALGAADAFYRANTTTGKTYLDETMISLISNNVTAIGYEAWAHATTAYHSLAIGTKALRDCTTGYDNTAVGVNAMLFLTTGNSNVAIGTDALYAGTDAINNVAVGVGALHDCVSGDNNIAVGEYALYNVANGSNNVAIGASAFRSLANSGSGIAIGYNAGYYETENNTLYIDNAPRASMSDGHAKALIYGQFEAAVANQVLQFNALYMGFFGHSYAVQPSHITDATNAADVITRANAIIAALESIGILAA
jgi:hypothetical protein